MADEKKSEPLKKNNLRTKLLPSLFMLLGGSIALVYGLAQHYPMTGLLLRVLIALFVFAILGTVIKGILDQFNMKMNYMDYFEENGDLMEKGGGNDTF